ncbi:MAG TPA: OmpA family protein [Amycolatopsis sp.]|uniref:OmpA family protein n=1 Tax=Amycolatopsis sp. TaxID=37632 RepID=UPI002B49A987|nr:OmpA family protein [Amycolatopsis sp.]HKS48252.1 OmpA family protein [Amycolatopsis sp.]
MHRTILFAALAVIPLALSGCDGSEPPSPASPAPACRAVRNTPVALAVGARANVPKPQLPSQVGDLMRDAAGAHQQLSLIRLDGRPEVVFDQRPPEPAKNGPADQQRTNDYLTAAEKAAADGLRARTAEADVLGALTLAGRATQGGGTIVVVDSGLQTVYPLNYAQDRLLEAEPSDVTAFLRDHTLLPDLRGRTVLLAGFGNTAAPQPDLDNRLRARLVATWRAIAEESGAACVDVLEQANTAKSEVDSPAVSVVPLPPPPQPPAPCGTVALGEDDNISFQPDTATFRDPGGARETLRKFAELLRDPRRSAELTGTTATQGTVSGRIALATHRAEAVKAVLVELGVAGERITTRGAGSDWPGHVPDLGPDGKLLPGPAAQNRKVVVAITCA